MASGALPPGCPAIEVDGELYWDGGLVSNTPLQWVVAGDTRQDTLTFQVDLWSARGDLPSDLNDVTARQKEIQYSSRTRANTDHFKQLQCVRAALANVLEKIPREILDSEDGKLLQSVADRNVYQIVHLIYRSKNYEIQSKDYEFSRNSMIDHWNAGYNDAIRTLRHPEALQRPTDQTGVATFDVAIDGRE
jgi:NTE family protein